MKIKILLTVFLVISFLSSCFYVDEVDVFVEKKPEINFHEYRGAVIVPPAFIKKESVKYYIESSIKDYLKILGFVSVETGEEINYKNLKNFINDKNFWIEYKKDYLISVIIFQIKRDSLNEIIEKNYVFKKEREIVSVYIYDVEGTLFLISGKTGKIIFKYTFKLKEKLKNDDDEFIVRLFTNILLERAFYKVSGEKFLDRRYIFTE